MEIIISNASDKPIYEQIASQIRALIVAGDLAEGQRLPSIRQLANDLRVSVITTKRAYEELERLGFINSVQGRGSFVACNNTELIVEEHLRTIEELLSRAIDVCAEAGVDPHEMHTMLDLLMDDK